MEPEAESVSLAELCRRGDAQADAGDYPAARAYFERARALAEREGTTADTRLWIYAALGDASFLGGDYAAAYATFAVAFAQPGAEGNPFLHMRYGQAALETGAREEALEHLRRAVAIAGPNVLAGQAEKYRDVLDLADREGD